MKIEDHRCVLLFDSWGQRCSAEWILLDVAGPRSSNGKRKRKKQRGLRAEARSIRDLGLSRSRAFRRVPSLPLPATVRKFRAVRSRSSTLSLGLQAAPLQIIVVIHRAVRHRDSIHSRPGFLGPELRPARSHRLRSESILVLYLCPATTYCSHVNHGSSQI